MCQNPEKNEITKPRTCHPPKNSKVHNLPPPKIGRVPNSVQFRGGKFWTLPFLGVVRTGLSTFIGWPVQDSVIFWILDSGNLGVAIKINHPVGIITDKYLIVCAGAGLSET